MYRLKGQYLDGTEYEAEFLRKGEVFRTGFSICFDGFSELKAYRDEEEIYKFNTDKDYMDDIDFRIKQKEIDKENRFLKEYERGM